MATSQRPAVVQVGLFDVDGTLIDTAESARSAIILGLRMALPQPGSFSGPEWMKELGAIAETAIEITEHQWSNRERKGIKGRSFAGVSPDGREAPTRPLLSQVGIGAYEALLLHPKDFVDRLHPSLARPGKLLADEIIGFQERIWSQALEEHKEETKVDPSHARVARASASREFLTPRTIVTTPGAELALKRLRALGLQLGIVSDGLAPVQARKLRAAGLDRYFPEANRFSGAHAVRKGPEGSLIKVALQSMGCLAKNAFFVGDRGVDVVEAEAAGIPYKWRILVGNKPVGTERYEAAAKGAVHIPQLTDLVGLFRGAERSGCRDAGSERSSLG